MEKHVELGYLLSFYGAVLTERQKKLMEQSVNDDFSLREIAEREHISRQGVRDSLKRAEEQLYFLEEKIGALRRYQALMSALEDTERRVKELSNEADRASLTQMIRSMRSIWEERDGV